MLTALLHSFSTKAMSTMMGGTSVLMHLGWATKSRHCCWGAKGSTHHVEEEGGLEHLRGANTQEWDAVASAMERCVWYLWQALKYRWQGCVQPPLHNQGRNECLQDPRKMLGMPQKHLWRGLRLARPRLQRRSPPSGLGSSKHQRYRLSAVSAED